MRVRAPILMKNECKLGFIGGDRRFVLCAETMAAHAVECTLFGTEKASENIDLCTRCDFLEDTCRAARALVLPLPVTRDGEHVFMPLSEKSCTVEEVFSCVSSHTPILCGGITPCVRRLAEKYHVEVYDYAAREDFKVSNAITTAEGAVSLALNEMPVTLCGCRCLVVGYGRIGKQVCRLLHAFGATVYASARKNEDLALIRASGCHPLLTEDIGTVVKTCALIVNTVPKTVLDRRVLSEVAPTALVIDLASKPGGVDFKAAEGLGLKVLWALSLPGKTAPVTAAETLSDTLLAVLRENACFEKGVMKCSDMP